MRRADSDATSYGNPHCYAHSCGHAGLDANCHTFSNRASESHAIAYRHTNLYAHLDTVTHCNTYAANPADGNRHADSHTRSSPEKPASRPRPV